MRYRLKMFLKSVIFEERETDVKLGLLISIFEFGHVKFQLHVRYRLKMVLKSVIFEESQTALKLGLLIAIFEFGHVKF